jgi:hypothetical protein
MIFVGIKTFGFLLFYQSTETKLDIGFAFNVFICCFDLTNAISEYFFWNEFGVKYNFIAVNYLVYTNEVIGNIMESYPVVPIFRIIYNKVPLLILF